MSRPLDGLLVLDFAQFLAGPMAALRLADLGARVVKVERPDIGELGRRLYLSELEIDGASALFQTINRNKQSFGADLKDEGDLDAVRALAARADVLIENFRPGVMTRLGLDYEALRAVNPRLVYASITGYGDRGPWARLPGQDLLVQARSGLMWLNGDADDPPVPVGISIVDIYAGALAVQGILAALVARGTTGRGNRVETSLLEASLDLQMQEFTIHLNDGGRAPRRSAVNNGHAYLAAPYGVYRTADGWMALAMNSLPRLAALLELSALAAFDEQRDRFVRRDEIKALLATHLAGRPTRAWLDVLEPADIWCAEVLTWERLLDGDAPSAMALVQAIGGPGLTGMRTTRCPVRIGGEVLTSAGPAPRIGQHTAEIARDFGLPVPPARRQA